MPFLPILKMRRSSGASKKENLTSQKQNFPYNIANLNDPMGNFCSFFGKTIEKHETWRQGMASSRKKGLIFATGFSILRRCAEEILPRFASASQ
jgi:hypothetical protein